VRFAMLASGGRIRLFDAGAPAGSTSRYLDLDNAYLQDKDRPLLAVLGPQYLHEGGFEVLRAEAEAFGAALRRRLDETIRDSVFPALGHALAGWAEKQGLDLSSEDTLAELERATLTLLFRLLFLLYAESSNYLPRDNRSYSHASLSSLNASWVRPDETSSNQEVQFLPRQGPASQRESSSALCEATTTAKRE